MVRDLRDPQKLGEAFFNERRACNLQGNFSIKAHEIADRLHLYNIPDYPQGESLATVTAKEYHDELEARAQEGDIYAASLLKGERIDDGE